MNGYLRNMQGPDPAGNNLPAATVSRSKLLPGKNMGNLMVTRSRSSCQNPGGNKTDAVV